MRDGVMFVNYVIEKTPAANPSPRPATIEFRSSCEPCHASKLRCSREKPRCARCRKNGTACTYALAKRPGRPRKGQSPRRKRDRASSHTGQASKTSQPSPPLASRPGDASPCTSRTQDVPITVSPSPGLEAASLETIDEPARFDFTTTAHDPTSLGLDAAMGCLDVFSWIATASPSTGITPNDTPVSLEQSTAGLSDGPAATQAMVQPSRQIVPATLPIEEAGQAHLSSSITSAAIPAGQGSKGLEQGHGQGQHHHHHHHHHGSLVPELSWPAAINPFLFVRNTPVVQDGEIWTMPADSPSQTARPLALSENSLSSPSVRESENNGEAAAAAAASDDDNDEGGPRCACQAALSNLLLLRHVGRHQNADQQASSPLELCLRLQRLLHQTRDAQKSCSACQDDELAKTVLVMVARDVAGLYRAIVNDFAAASRHGRAAQNQRRGTNSRASSGMGGVAAVGAADHHLMQQPLPLPLPATSPLSDATQLRMGSKTIDGSVKFGFLRRLVGLKLRQASALLGELDGSMASTALGPLLRGICKHIDVTLGMLLVAEA